MGQNNHKAALPYMLRGYEIAKKLNDQNLTKDALSYLSRVYAALGNFKLAYESYVEFTKINDEILNGESIKRIADMQIRYETEKKERELKEKSIEVIQQKEQNRRQTIFIYYGLVLLIFVSVSALLIIRQNKKDRKANELLAIKNQEILQQKEEISAQRDAIEEQKNEIEKQRDVAEKRGDEIASQNQKITDSIEYASRIQSAVLPPLAIMNAILPSYFIMYRPRDIVSGDFYFVRKAKNKTVVAAVDCTGHGVPGAFMSMLGSSLLTEIVGKELFENAADILERLRENVKNALHQTGGNDDKTSDGMDCALCVIDYENNYLDFAGANNPLVIIRNEEMIEYNGDRMPIGVHLIEEGAYTNHRIELQANDMIYMYSDGYQDQFGGDKGRKLFIRNFKQYLMDVHKMPPAEQKIQLEALFDAWKGNYKQIDDVIVMGLKI
jgi:serine phosphatase RsbU (regulator of sigma subunit)